MKYEHEATLCEHQSVLYQLLLAFDGVCKKHNIKYMLFAGTALGAVRHQGFIPWDDDLDVVMLRPEYDRFLSAAEQELDKDKYCLQKEFTDHWPMFFSKLRMQGTTCLERYVPKDPLTNLGIYIDIFPCDNLADNKLLRKLQFATSKVVIAKALDRRGYLTKSVPKKVFIRLCRALPNKRFLKIIQRRNDNSAWVHTFLGAASKFEKNVFPREWFEEIIWLPFENGEYPVSAHYDELLTVLYGDYMTPLPEEKRGSKVHAEFVDVNNPYTCYREWHRNMVFSEYTRSIR